MAISSATSQSASAKLIRSIATIPHTQLDTETCSLLGPFSILIQALMALIILASLLYKRHREKPKRKYRVWTADVSKQVLGQAFVHMLNIFISDSMASLPSKGNPCALYFMNIFIDTTIGVFVLFLALNTITKLICKTLRRTPASLGLSSGTYPHPFLISWTKQISVYFLGLAILKLFVIGLFWLGGEALVRFGNGVIEGISHDPKVQILMVVMVGPTILNVLQFLLIDSFIRHKPGVSPEDVAAEDGRRFLGGESDLDSDDQGGDEDEEDEEEDDDTENGPKPRGSATNGRQDRRVRKKKDFPNDPATRQQHTRLSNPSSLHGAPSGLAADVQNPHSYPPRSSLAETQERRHSPSRELSRKAVDHAGTSVNGLSASGLPGSRSPRSPALVSQPSSSPSLVPDKPTADPPASPKQVADGVRSPKPSNARTRPGHLVPHRSQLMTGFPALHPSPSSSSPPSLSCSACPIAHLPRYHQALNQPVH